MFDFIDINDPQIWVTVSFFFIIFAILYGKTNKLLDNKISAINEEIVISGWYQEAKNLLQMK